MPVPVPPGPPLVPIAARAVGLSRIFVEFSGDPPLPESAGFEWCVRNPRNYSVSKATLVPPDPPAGSTFDVDPSAWAPSVASVEWVEDEMTCVLVLDGALLPGVTYLVTTSDNICSSP